MSKSLDKREFLNIIDNLILAKSNRATALDTLDTLTTLTGNALQDINKRSIKLSNPVITRKLIQVKGAIEYLQLHGCKWSHHVVQFEERLVFPAQPTQLQQEALQLGHDTIKARTTVLKDTFNKSLIAQKANKEDEQGRKARALMAIEDDRQQVRERAERERVAREAQALAKVKADEAAIADSLAERETPSVEDRKDR